MTVNMKAEATTPAYDFPWDEGEDYEFDQDMEIPDVPEWADEEWFQENSLFPPHQCDYEGTCCDRFDYCCHDYGYGECFIDDSAKYITATLSAVAAVGLMLI